MTIVLFIALGVTAMATVLVFLWRWAGARSSLARIRHRPPRPPNGLHQLGGDREMLTLLAVHDLKNPLTAIRASVEVVLERIANMPELRNEAEDLRVAVVESARLAGMLNDLLFVSGARRGSGGDRRIDRASVRALLEDVLHAASAQAGALKVRLELDAPSDLHARIDAPLIRRLVENLVMNGLRYTRPGDRIQLAARAIGGQLELAVRNTGAPLSAQARARLFEKYATGGDGGWQSSGLGLYVCNLVAKAHGGTISLVEREGWGVSFEAILPVAERTNGG